MGSVRRQLPRVAGVGARERRSPFAYHHLVAALSRGQHWDGVLPLRKARGVLLSRWGETDAARLLGELESVALIEIKGDRLLVVRAVVEHLPSESVRRRSVESKERMARKRAHERGDHDLCDPAKCADAVYANVYANTPATPDDSPVHANVHAFVGSGRVGSGQALDEGSDLETQEANICGSCGDQLPAGSQRFCNLMCEEAATDEKG